MINILKDLTINSMIGMLPSVINYNNNSIKSDFDYIFDYDRGCYYHDLINPTGIVKSHWGEFVNLTVDTIRIKDPSTLFNSSFKNIQHNSWAGRFSDPSVISESDQEKYAHDIKSIKGLEERLNDLSTAIEEYRQIYKMLTATNINNEIYSGSGTVEEIRASSTLETAEQTRINNPSNSQNLTREDNTEYSDSALVTENTESLYGSSRSVNMPEYNKQYIKINGNPTEYTYPKSLMTESQSVMKKEAKYNGDYRDLQACKLYHYIDIQKTDISYVLIKNNCQYALNNAKIGQVVYLIPDRQDKLNPDQEFIIKLKGCFDEHLYIKANIPPEEEIPLICFKNDRNLGSCWKLQDGYESSYIEIK